MGGNAGGLKQREGLTYHAFHPQPDKLCAQSLVAPSAAAGSPPYPAPLAAVGVMRGQKAAKQEWAFIALREASPVLPAAGPAAPSWAGLHS
jgi:hypothetical protein